MLPIPAFNPGDTVTYPNGNGVIQVGAADAGSKMLLYNESPFNINIDFLNGSQSILHAWEARYWTLDGDTRQVEWDINSALNVTSSPISLVIGELYGATERLEGTYPMGLIRQTNVGNPGGVATTSSTGITNDNNNAGTSIVESTVAGQTGSSVSLTNDAIFKLLVVIAGTLIQVLKTNTVDPLVQIGAATHLAEILGNLKVDGTLESVGALTADALISANGGLQLPNNVALSALDAAAASHNILSVLANNHVVIGPAGQGIDQVDGSGNILLRTTSTAVIVNKVLQMLNNVAIQSADSLGTQRNILYGDASNLTHVRSLAAGAQVSFEDSAGAQVGWFDGGGGGCKNGTFQAPRMQQTGAVANGSTISGIRFMAFTSVPSGISTLTHNFGFVPDVAFFACGQAANTNPGTATNSVYNWLANTCTLNIAAAVNGVLVYIKA